MSQDLRKKIISLHKKDEGYKKISKALLIRQNTVAKVVQTFKKDGTATISQRCPGRPRKLTPRQERLLMRRVEENRHASLLQLSKEVESQTGVTISRDTIRRTLQRNGMPLLKPRHKKARLEFARAHADKDEDYWDSILWSDESKINVFGTDGFKTVWCRKGEEYKEKCMVPTVKHGGGSVLMWGCMSAAGVEELHFIDGIMNSKMYCSILKEKILPSLRALGRRALFQHDNDPKHTSKATVGFLKNRVKVIQWPSMSSDLNPIEHLWGILKRQVEHHSPSSIQSLKEVILEEWKKIDLAKCHQLVHSDVILNLVLSTFWKCFLCLLTLFKILLFKGGVLIYAEHCIYIYIYIYVCVYMYMYVYICKYVYIYMYVCICVYILVVGRYRR